MPKPKTTKKAKDDDSKVFDVAKPGKTPATPTAKPIIVGHKTLLQDPMVKTADTDELVPDKEDVSLTQVSTTAPTIQPIDDNTEEKPGAEEEKPQKKNSIAVTDVSETAETQVKTGAAVPTDTEPKAQDSIPDDEEQDQTVSPEQAEDEPGKTDETAHADAGTEDETPAETNGDDEPQTNGVEAGGSDGAAVAAVADQAGSKKEADKLAQQEAEKQAAIEKLITDKKYYAPIGEKKHRRTLLATLMLLFLAIILGLLLVNTLIELDIIHANIEPPIRIFSR